MRAWWALLLLIPTASAGDFQWIAPDVATAGQPIQAAYVIVEGDGLEGHVNVDLTIMQNDTLRFHSASVHEHDGMHPFYYTPSAGTLELRATTPQGTYVHAIEVVDATPADSGRQSLEGASLRAEMNLGGQTIYAGTDHGADGAHYEDMMLMWDAFDDGRLEVSTVSHIHQLLFFDVAQESGISRIDGLFTDLPNQDDGRAPGLSMASLDLETVQPAASQVPWPAPERQTTCTNVIADPAPQVAETWAWSPHSDIRLTVWEAEPPLVRGNGYGHTYTLEQYVDWGDALTPQWETLWEARSHGLFSPITFAPEPGEYRLLVEPIGVHPGEDCVISLTILPDASEAGATATLSSFRHNDTFRFELEAHDASGAALPHYEFETRVWTTPYNVTEGALVYAGKLHTHAGPASFTLDGLAPGQYHVRVQPSAQNPEHPRAIAPAPYSFTVEAPELEVQDELASAPLGVVAVLAIALLGRRYA